ncbi:MAG: Cytidine deaminase [bacterium]|nr:Cytidine deaminase [bacterium]
MTTTLSPTDLEQLYDAARSMLSHSYAPYSRFRVSAALRTVDGTLITGVNVENGAYPQTICAERSAIVAAVSQGHRKFTDIAIVCLDEAHPDLPHILRPCGGCLSVMSEFSPTGDLLVHCLHPHQVPDVLCLRDLMPYPFHFGGPSLSAKDQ